MGVHFFDTRGRGWGFIFLTQGDGVGVSKILTKDGFADIVTYGE